jgi:hypothetical protein
LDTNVKGSDERTYTFYRRSLLDVPTVSWHGRGSRDLGMVRGRNAFHNSTVVLKLASCFFGTRFIVVTLQMPELKKA